MHDSMVVTHAPNTPQMSTDDIQPNGIDFRIHEVFELLEDNFTISQNGKTHRRTRQVQPDPNGIFHLTGGRQYDIITNLNIDLTAVEATALLYIRSTFSRNGFTIASGVYDTGFVGRIGTVLHTPMSFKSHLIEQGTALGQVMLYKSNPSSLYTGQYQNTTENWREQVKHD